MNSLISDKDLFIKNLIAVTHNSPNYGKVISKKLCLTIFFNEQFFTKVSGISILKHPIDNEREKMS